MGFDVGWNTYNLKVIYTDDEKFFNFGWVFSNNEVIFLILSEFFQTLSELFPILGENWKLFVKWIIYTNKGDIKW